MLGAMLPEGGTAARFLETGLGVGCWSQGSPTGRQKAGWGWGRWGGGKSQWAKGEVLKFVKSDFL